MKITTLIPELDNASGGKYNILDYLYILFLISLAFSKFIIFLKENDMRKKLIRFIAEVSIFTALGLVLDLVAGLISASIWKNGGSISLAMVPIIIMGYKYGLKGGLTTGLLIGTIQLLWSEYLITVPQVLLDYIVPNVVIGLVGIVAKPVQKTKGDIQALIIIGSIVIVCALRLASLVASGILYWEAGFAYSITYNGTYTGISMAICIAAVIVLMRALPKKYLTE